MVVKDETLRTAGGPRFAGAAPGRRGPAL